MIAESPVILIATDNDQLRQVARLALGHRGFRVQFAGAPADPPDAFRETRTACVLMEAGLGSPRVAELLAAVARHQPDLPILLMQNDAGSGATEPVSQGGFRGYLPAPLEPTALVSAVERALWGAGPTGEVVTPRDASLLYQQLAAAALEALVHAMEAKDAHLPGHSLRVAELAASIATRLGRADWEVEEVRLAGRLHDLGMIAIPDAILTKAGPLTAEEYAEVKRHPLLGCDILRAYPNMDRVATYVRGHHERWDGSGYPDHLVDEAIPWGAQVLAAAETFDAITSSRSYRSASSVTEALERVYTQSADAIDPSVLRVLSRVVSRRETLSFIRDDNDLPMERGLLAQRDPEA